MAERTYMLVGNWHFVPGPRGYTRYSYDPETAEMDLIDTDFNGYSVGHQAIDEERGIAYIVDERGDLRTDDGSKRCGGGGYVAALRVKAETGALDMINEKRTLATGPSYVCLDKSKRYCIVVHHVGFFYVSKILKNDDGGYISKTYFDDPAVVLFRINEDGSLGEICDVSIIESEGVAGPHTCGHLHCVVPDPTYSLFFVCDKGLDKIYSFQLDREKGKLRRMDEAELPLGCKPRYCVCHPTLPVLYSNNEKNPNVFTFRFDVNTGRIQQLAVIAMGLPPSGNDTEARDSEPSDIVISPHGTCLYVSERMNQTISVFSVDGEGALTLKQTIACGGKNPRGLCLSPDNRFLLVANSDTPCIAVFRVQEDGSLQEYKTNIPAVCPANIRFLQF